MGSRKADGTQISQSRESMRNLGEAYTRTADRTEVNTRVDHEQVYGTQPDVEDSQNTTFSLGGGVFTSPSGLGSPILPSTAPGPNLGTPPNQSIFGTNIVVVSGTTIISGAITNIYGDTTVISGTTTNIYGGDTYISGSTTVNIGTVGSGTITIAISGNDQWEFDSDGNFVTRVADNYILSSKRVLNYPESAVSITQLDTGTTYTNANGGTGITKTLPQAKKGLEFTFIGYAAGSPGMTIATNHATDTILLSTAKAGGVGASNPNITCSGQAASVKLLCIGVESNNLSGVWVATSMMGNWTTADA